MDEVADDLVERRSLRRARATREHRVQTLIERVLDVLRDGVRDGLGDSGSNASDRTIRRLVSAHVPSPVRDNLGVVLGIEVDLGDAAVHADRDVLVREALINPLGRAANHSLNKYIFNYSKRSTNRILFRHLFEKGSWAHLYSLRELGWLGLLARSVVLGRPALVPRAGASAVGHGGPDWLISLRFFFNTRIYRDEIPVFAKIAARLFVALHLRNGWPRFSLRRSQRRVFLWGRNLSYVLFVFLRGSLRKAGTLILLWILSRRGP